MTLYMVSTDYGYDGGLDVLGVYTTVDQAQKEREKWIAAKLNYSEVDVYAFEADTPSESHFMSTATYIERIK